MNNFLFFGGLGNFFSKILHAFSPLLIGLILAYLISPLSAWLEKKLKHRTPAIFLSYLIVFGVIFGLLYSFVVLIIGAIPTGGIEQTLSKVSEYFQDAYAYVSSAVEKVTLFVEKLNYKFNFSTGGVKDDVLDMSDNIMNSGFDTFGAWVSHKFSIKSIVEIFSKVTGNLASFVIGIVASIYLVKDREFFIGLWEKFLSLIVGQKTHGVMNEIFSEIHCVITTFIKGAFIDSLIVGFLSAVALTLLGVDFGVLIGVICGFFNIIPYFGPFFGMALAFFVALFGGNIFKGILSVVSLFLIQQVDANFVYPRVVGKATGLHPLFVLIAVSVMGYLLGIIGMLVAVPVAGVVQVFITRWAYGKG